MSTCSRQKTSIFGCSSGWVPTVEPTQAGGGGGGQVDLVAMGEQVARNAGCTACHSVDGSTLVGPSWKGLFGHEVQFADGTTATAI